MLICHPSVCVGCGVCKVLCTAGAIRFVEDHEGFLRPRVDALRCISCGCCQRACPANGRGISNRECVADYYGGAAKDVNEVCSSTSGGVASVLAQQMIAEGGVVFGAAFDPFPRVAHVRLDSSQDIERLKGSKYVESDITKSLPMVREALVSGRKVLFVGLPCHVAALYGYLGGDPKGLYTIDLVCHGKPPQKLFSRWISNIERTLQGKIVEYKFRDKQLCDWNDGATYRHYYRLEDGRTGWIPERDNWYGRYFLGSSSFRPSCYQCKFAKLPRVADITLADFWGADKDTRFVRFVKKGLSLVSVQSASGREFLGRAKKNLDLVKVPSEFAIRCNRGLDHASRGTIYRSVVFWFAYWPEPLRRLADALVFGCATFVKRIRERT